MTAWDDLRVYKHFIRGVIIKANRNIWVKNSLKLNLQKSFYLLEWDLNPGTCDD